MRAACALNKMLYIKENIIVLFLKSENLAGSNYLTCAQINCSKKNVYNLLTTKNLVYFKQKI